MATAKENKRIWDNIYNWKEGGEEWSRPWGGTDMEWYFTILPRIHSFVPTGTILEIASGFGECHVLGPDRQRHAASSRHGMGSSETAERRFDGAGTHDPHLAYGGLGKFSQFHQ